MGFFNKKKEEKRTRIACRCINESHVQIEHEPNETHCEPKLKERERRNKKNRREINNRIVS